MGKAKLGLRRLTFKDFSKGYFYGKDFDEVPEGGSTNCKHVIWNRSALRKMFGMDVFNASQASNLVGSGIHHFNTNSNSKLVLTFGPAIYWNDAGTPTDVTGAVTITPGTLWQFIDHQQGANEYIIGCNGVDPVIKWTGTGNADVLGGTPPVFSSVEKFRDHIFGSNGQFVYFSDFADPETWDTTKWAITFHKDVVRIAKIGDVLAVMMRDHIGSISGYTYLDFTREEEEVGTFGCVGRQACTKVKFGESGTDALAIMANDGLHILDSTFNHTKIFNEDYIDVFNKAYLSICSMAFDKSEGLIYCALPYGSSIVNNYLVVMDSKTGAIWPCPDIHANAIASMTSYIDADGNESVCFCDTDGYYYKFNKDTKNYSTGSASQAIDSYWQSKKLDLDDVYDLRESIALAESDGDWSLTVGILLGINLSSSFSADFSLLSSGAVFDSTYLFDASYFSGDSDYKFDFVSGIGGSGRFFSFFLSNDDADESFNVKRFEFHVKRRRMGYADK